MASAVKAAVPSPTKDVPIAVVQQKSPAAAPQRKQRVSPVLKELLAQVGVVQSNPPGACESHYLHGIGLLCCEARILGGRG